MIEQTYLKKEIIIIENNSTEQTLRAVQRRRGEYGESIEILSGKLILGKRYENY